MSIVATIAPSAGSIRVIDVPLACGLAHTDPNPTDAWCTPGTGTLRLALAARAGSAGTHSAPSTVTNAAACSSNDM